MTVLGLAFAVLAPTLYRPLFGRPQNSSANDRGPEAAVGRGAQSSPAAMLIGLGAGLVALPVPWPLGNRADAATVVPPRSRRSDPVA